MVATINVSKLEFRNIANPTRKPLYTRIHNAKTNVAEFEFRKIMAPPVRLELTTP